jgi:hypothetical protein
MSDINKDSISVIRAVVRRGDAVRIGVPEIDKAIVKYGRPFIGIKRPKGYRQRKRKECFRNAFLLALDGRGIYVEGFANVTGTNFVFCHGWNTLDGAHAIDATLPNAPEHHYLGVPFSPEVLARWIIKLGYQPPFFSWKCPIELMREILEDARLHPPVFPSSKDAA